MAVHVDQSLAVDDALGLFASATVVIGFMIGLPWGAIGMAKAYFFGEALRTPILFWLAARVRR